MPSFRQFPEPLSPTISPALLWAIIELFSISGFAISGHFMSVEFNNMWSSGSSFTEHVVEVHPCCSKHQKLVHFFFYGCQGGRMGGRDSSGVWDGHVHSAVFKTDD